MQEIQLPSLGGEDPLEEEMATHSRILAWEIPQAEEPSGLQSMGFQRVFLSHVLSSLPLDYLHLEAEVLLGKAIEAEVN